MERQHFRLQDQPCTADIKVYSGFSKLPPVVVISRTNALFTHCMSVGQHAYVFSPSRKLLELSETEGNEFHLFVAAQTGVSSATYHGVYAAVNTHTQLSVKGWRELYEVPQAEMVDLKCAQVKAGNDSTAGRNGSAQVLCEMVRAKYNKGSLRLDMIVFENKGFDWKFVEAFGKDAAKELIPVKAAAGTTTPPKAHVLCEFPKAMRTPEKNRRKREFY
ncbi:hypothetical protein SCP_0411330 [Sparassis crispa]|uniref:DUF6697 domain-containing protein n=1 Tax=Sparassis crispa TaxID=139825 RepID=A0A401GKQ0_9APHY|nr:hypothetical protein SCP_0411330 [Sparassis crispa]GBE82748.1 hypothetical protein SCP_0411330 [Sparassis crispa]